MSTRDAQLWRRFTDRGALPWTTLYFDVALGSGDLPHARPEEPTASMWERLTSFRADVIGESTDQWGIIELRDNAGPGAIGALLTYAHLWRLDPPDKRPVQLHLVTNRVHPDLNQLLEQLAITLHLV